MISQLYTALVDSIEYDHLVTQTLTMLSVRCTPPGFGLANNQFIEVYVEPDPPKNMYVWKVRLSDPFFWPECFPVRYGYVRAETWRRDLNVAINYLHYSIEVFPKFGSESDGSPIDENYVYYLLEKNSFPAVLSRLLQRWPDANLEKIYDVADRRGISRASVARTIKNKYAAEILTQ